MKNRDSYLPIFFLAEGAPALVAGAGRVALRKIRSLLRRGARVTVVAPEASTPVLQLAKRGMIRLIEGAFREEHLDGMAIVFAATSDPRVNRSIFRGASRRGIPVNVADSPDDCTFLSPAVVEGKGFTLAVSTGGRHPGAARAIREFLEDRREEISVRMERGRRRKEIRAAPGKVHIVGAGPGNPDLLTIRALGLLRSADVVIHDYLVSEEILSLAPERAVKICFARRGRTAGHGSRLKQVAIHEAMVRFAREGKAVVRLKSGDPFVFGRGGEEAECLATSGIPFEIVPGITAAIGCAAAANLPLTHREFSSSVTFVAGHESAAKEGSGIDWKALPRDGTIAVYMAVERIRGVEEDLIGAGFPPDTPFAIVENGTRLGQRIVRGRLHRLSRLAEESGVVSPAVLFLGKSAGIAMMKETERETVHGSIAKSV